MKTRFAYVVVGEVLTPEASATFDKACAQGFPKPRDEDKPVLWVADLNAAIDWLVANCPEDYILESPA